MRLQDGPQSAHGTFARDVNHVMGFIISLNQLAKVGAKTLRCHGPQSVGGSSARDVHIAVHRGDPTYVRCSRFDIVSVASRFGH